MTITRTPNLTNPQSMRDVQARCENCNGFLSTTPDEEYGDFRYGDSVVVSVHRCNGCGHDNEELS